MYDILLPPDSKGYTFTSGLCFWLKRAHNLAIIVSVGFVLTTKELSSLRFLNLLPSAVLSLKINDVWTIILYLNMIQPLGTRLSTQEPKKSHCSIFSFFHPSNFGNWRNDASLLNLIGGIYIFLLYTYIDIYIYSLYNNCHIISLMILICHDWR